MNHSAPRLAAFEIDPRLESVFCAAMAELQLAIGRAPELRSPITEAGAVDCWCAHYAVLLFGACDAARVLVTNNLAREANGHKRQAYEYLNRAVYLADNPRSAVLEIRAEPLRRFKLLTDAGITSGTAYDRLKSEADAATQRFPDIASFKLPPFEQMVSNISKQRALLYTMHYRVPSSDFHGSVLSFPGSLDWESNGSLTVNFDSRRSKKELDRLFGILTNYALSYCKLIAMVFSIPPNGEVEVMFNKNELIRKDLEGRV